MLSRVNHALALLKMVLASEVIWFSIFSKAVEVMLSQPEELRRQMALIRAGARGTAGQIKADTQQLLDWKFQLRSHPWMFLGATMLVGYFVVPTRRKAIPVPILPNVASRANGNQVFTEREQTVSPAAKTGILATIVGLGTSFAYKYAMSYATSKAKEWLLGAAQREVSRRTSQGAKYDEFSRGSF